MNLEKLWKAKDISNDTKVVIYMTMVQSVVTYNVIVRTLKKKRMKEYQLLQR